MGREIFDITVLPTKAGVTSLLAAGTSETLALGATMPPGHTTKPRLADPQELGIHLHRLDGDALALQGFRQSWQRLFPCKEVSMK